MGSRQAHLIQARHNEDLIHFLDPDSIEFPDWVITATFYSALHYVEAGFNNNSNIWHSHMCKMPREPIHDTRERLLRDNYNLQVYQSYKNLFDASYISRYLWDRATRQDVLSGYRYFTRQEVRDFYDKDLANVKREFGFRHPWP
jgi:hypothetical protein